MNLGSSGVMRTIGWRLAAEKTIPNLNTIPWLHPPNALYVPQHKTTCSKRTPTTL
jgi:hypothetical protein